MSIFTKLATALQGRQQSRKTEWGKTVYAVAKGDEPDAENLEQLLRDTGKSLADLEADVAKLHKRQRDAEALQRAKDSAKALDAANLEHAAFKKEWDAVLEKYQSRESGIETKIAELRRVQAAGDQARSDLQSGIIDPELSESIRATTHELNRLSNESHDLAERRREAVATVAQAVGSENERILAAAEVAKRVIASCDADLPAITKAIPAAERKLADLHNRALTP